MTEPKLLTEAEARALAWRNDEAIVTELRDRGLIAEEPVDPLREAMGSLFEAMAWPYSQNELNRVCNMARNTLAAERKELTRDMVRDAYEKTEPFCSTSAAHITRLHAALTEALK